MTGLQRSAGTGELRVTVDIPHAGRAYPETFETLCSRTSLVRTEDRFADLLYAPIARRARRSLAAPYPRTYVDLNRPRLRGSGVVRQAALDGSHIQALPSEEQFEARMSAIYDPYYRALAEDIGEELSGRRSHTHLNLHTFPTADWHTVGHPPMPYEVEIGDLSGEASPRGLGRKLAEAFEREGFVVGYNDVFPGGEILRWITSRYEGAVESVQIEVRRDLYLDDDLHVNSERMAATQERIARVLDKELSDV